MCVMFRHPVHRDNILHTDVRATDADAARECVIEYWRYFGYAIDVIGVIRHTTPKNTAVSTELMDTPKAYEGGM